MRIAARIVAALTLLAFARGPALACYALPQAVATGADDCCHMVGMGGSPGCSSQPARTPRPCCHPDNLGDQAYLRAASVAAPAVDVASVLLLGPVTIGRPLARPVLSSAVQSHAPPGRLVSRITVLRL